MAYCLEDGSRLLDAGLLVGEKLGLELAELTARLNEVWFTPVYEGKVLFLDEDFPILIEGFDRIRNALRESIDERGRPRGEGGERLRSSPSIEQYADGGLVTRGRRVRLVELLTGLDELVRFMAFARDHALIMSYGDLDAPGTVDEQGEGLPSIDDEDRRS
ncbi:hypothetical protein [Melittangium boletus]|uniref:hypothetical protein n=1 Tax=Melittangium boletus TaxID=83453 RepID=UPI003DA36092